MKPYSPGGRPLSADDRLEIAATIARYCHATDAGDGAATAAEYTEDALLEVVGAFQARGRDAIAQIGAMPNKPRHWVNNIAIHGHASEARAVVSFAAVPAGGSVAATGRYESVLSKQLDGRWKIAEKRYTGDGAAWPAPPAAPGVLTAQDRLAIQELVARTDDALDRRDAEGWASAFTGYGIYRVGDGPEVAGHEALAASVRELPAAEGRHWTTNHVLAGTDESATARMYVAIVRGTAFVDSGLYDDVWHKVDGTWRLARRHRTIDAPPGGSG